MQTLLEHTRKRKPTLRPLGMSVILIAGTLSLVWGCLSDLRVYEPTPSTRAALHPVCCAGMRKVMHSINKTYRRAVRLPIRQMRTRNFAKLQECARRIATHAKSIVKEADLSGVGLDDRLVFEKLASRLGETADALSEAAAEHNRTETRELFARMTSTCNSCHAAFRNPELTTHTGGSR